MTSEEKLKYQTIFDKGNFKSLFAPIGKEQMQQVFLLFCLTFLVTFSAFAQRDKSALLPASEAKNVTRQCSRPSPEKFSDTWEPSQEEIREMEVNFSKIKRLKVEECCIQGAQIENPEEYYMQYAGIIVDGKKLIYINAFPKPETKSFVKNADGTLTETAAEYWKTFAVNICDGGTAWGVLYDLKTKKFFDLAINGVA